LGAVDIPLTPERDGDRAGVTISIGAAAHGLALIQSLHARSLCAYCLLRSFNAAIWSFVFNGHRIGRPLAARVIFSTALSYNCRPLPSDLPISDPIMARDKGGSIARSTRQI